MHTRFFYGVNPDTIGPLHQMHQATLFLSVHPFCFGYELICDERDLTALFATLNVDIQGIVSCYQQSKSLGMLKQPTFQAKWGEHVCLGAMARDDVLCK